MNLLTQDFAVLVIVLACVAVIAYQAWKTFYGRRSRLGNCCARGCASQPPKSAQRTVFLPVDLLAQRASSRMRKP